jgi:hypothetical protein
MAAADAEAAERSVNLAKTVISLSSASASASKYKLIFSSAA